MSSSVSQVTDLLFGQPAPTDADLLFGTDFVAPGNDLTIQATLPTPDAVITLNPLTRFELLIQLPALTVFASEVHYFSRTQRPTVNRSEHVWQVARHVEDGLKQNQQDANARPSGLGVAWRRTESLPQGVSHKLPPVLSASHKQCRVRHQDATPLMDATWFKHQIATHIEVARHGVFQNARAIQDATHFQHQDNDHSKRVSRLSSWQNGRKVMRCQGSDFQSALAWPLGLRGRYQNAIPSLPGISLVVIPSPPPKTPCYTLSTALLFAAPAATDSYLLFICDNQDNQPPTGEQVVVPIRRLYFVINNVTLHRVSDNAAVPVFNLSLSLDASSWTWGFEASLPASAETLVDPGAASAPVELLVSVNGTEFLVLAEDISRERSFGEASIRVSGRGHNAVLAAPYAPIMNFQQPQARTARQLMDDVLTVNGVPLGWSVDWGLTDWNVPAGAFAHQGTWIEALAAIANAAGGYLIPHPTTQSLRVRHRYPVVPWEWSSVTPDFVLPVDAVSRESLRWLEKPAYNRVFVSGQEVGVLGQVTRTGTAGDILAPMVVDALITEAPAARQRGIAVLADTGRQLEVSLRLPILEETGIIEPGAFVEYQDGSVTRIGMVRSTQVQAGFPEVWQTLGVQTYA